MNTRKPYSTPLLLLLLTLGILLAQPVFADAGAGGGTRMVVALEADYDISQVTQLAQQYGATVLRVDDRLHFAVFELPETSAQGDQGLQGDENVRFVENDAQVLAAFTPNDPIYNDPLKVYGPQQIEAEDAWNFTLGDPAVTIAVLDSGIDFNHPEFSGRILPGWDFVNDDADASDDLGHGTHVAGIIAAAIDNGIGIAGMAGASTLLPVKVLDENAVGWWSDVASGITWAVDQGAQVINLSLGGTTDSAVVHNAIDYAIAQNVAVVTASGNNGSDQLFFPASYDDVIAVAATNYSGRRWTLSDYGPNVDVMAPGVSIYSTSWDAGSGSTYENMSGTSMAAPHVAGLAALMRSVNPDLPATEIKNILQITATDMGDPGFDALTGYGLVNARLAVQTAMQSNYLIDGVVFYDWNQNQIMDSTDSGIDLIQVCLYRDVDESGTLDGNDQQLVCQITGPTGAYVFEGLSAGAYLIAENQPARFLDTTPNVWAATLGAQQTGGQSEARVNFGDIVYSAATGMVFWDSNGSGAQDPGEYLGVPGIPITLTNLVTLEAFATLTDGNGAYAFGTLLPGTYELETPLRVEGLTQTTSHTMQFSIGVDETVTGPNFGYISPTAVQLASFTVVASDTGTTLRWSTAGEENQTGFVVWRAIAEQGNYKAVSGIIPATNDPNGSQYKWIDQGVGADSAAWYMLQSLPDGAFYGPIPTRLPEPDFTALLFTPVVLR